MILYRLIRTKRVRRREKLPSDQKLIFAVACLPGEPAGEFLFSFHPAPTLQRRPGTLQLFLPLNTSCIGLAEPNFLGKFRSAHGCAPTWMWNKENSKCGWRGES